ncbi:MAG: hypothetical protein GX202_05330 [Firmicutes bacterium]|nr:hypothetical protein [Bacillota bacterium]
MKANLRRQALVAMVAVLFFFSFSGVALALVENDLQLLWDSLAEEDYQRALELAVAQGQENPLYFLLAFYLSHVSFNSSAEIRLILWQYYTLPSGDESLQTFAGDLAQYAAEKPFVYKLAMAIVEFNEYRNKAEAVKLVQESLAERETALGYYLDYCFTDNAESCKKAALLSQRPAYLNQHLLILDYNEKIESGREPEKDKYVTELEKLLANDDYYFDIDNYHNFIQLGLGEKWVSAIGPSGPNNEPFFGALCDFTAWDSFPKFAPRHQILMTLAVAGPGGQNSWHGEQLLGRIDEETLEIYAPLVKMIRIYENFHDYQYEEVYRLANELLAMITDPFYFLYFYDLAYEYEMFFFADYYPDQTMIDKAVLIYDKAYQLAPPDSPYWQGMALRGKGRSQYYAGRYQDSLATLTKVLALTDDPVSYIFICLDYYALGDLENGAAWEEKVRSFFAGYDNTLQDFERLLGEVKGGT